MDICQTCPFAHLLGQGSRRWGQNAPSRHLNQIQVPFSQTSAAAHSTLAPVIANPSLSPMLQCNHPSGEQAMLYRSGQGTYFVVRDLQGQPEWSEFPTIPQAWRWLKSEGFQPELLY